jgi:hypothetical protein
MAAARENTVVRIYGSQGTAVATGPTAARRTSGGGFSVSEQDEAKSASASTSLRTVAGIDALIALQGVEDPTERRKRAVRHGRNALDVLDDLKVGLLDGSLDTSTLGRMKAAAETLKVGSGEPGLDGVLGEISLRLEVELAKAGVA